MDEAIKPQTNAACNVRAGIMLKVAEGQVM